MAGNPLSGTGVNLVSFAFAMLGEVEIMRRFLSETCINDAMRSRSEVVNDGVGRGGARLGVAISGVCGGGSGWASVGVC